MNLNESVPCVKNSSAEELNEFSYESALYKALEELRLKRKIEQENQKDIYDLLQKKYDQEKCIEEERRLFKEEKTALEEKINNLQNALEQEKCVTKCDLKNQDMFKKMFESEINSLREELKSMHMVKRNLERKCQDFEAEAKLHKSLKEATVKRVNILQQELKELKTLQEQLKKLQSTLKGNVEEANSVLIKYDLTNRHLCEIVSFMAKRIKLLSSELVKSESKLKFIAATIERPSKDIKHNTNTNAVKNMDIVNLEEKVNERHQKILEVLVDIRNARYKLIETKEEQAEDEHEKVEVVQEAVQIKLEVQD